MMLPRQYVQHVILFVTLFYFILMEITITYFVWLNSHSHNAFVNVGVDSSCEIKIAQKIYD